MNILLFGPNGSGKGTQGAMIERKCAIPLIESGALFRENIARGTELGQKAREYIDRGELVPDEVTIPMVLERLRQPDCARGWVLDGFPRNLYQARKLDEALARAGMRLDYVIEIVLDRRTARERIMGRRLCLADPSHPNNVSIAAIQPLGEGEKEVCRVCRSGLVARSDDQDELAIQKRHEIYYDREKGTLAAVAYFKEKAKEGGWRAIEVDGRPGVEEVSAALLKKLEGE